MKRFWKRSTDPELAAELRRGRPAPRQELVDDLVARIDAESRRSPSLWRPRVALVSVVSAVTLVAFGAFGGLGYAKTAASGTVFATAHAVAKIAKAPSQEDTVARDRSAERGGNEQRNGNDHGSKPGHHQYQEHVIICHKGHTISVSSSAVPAHLRHGDTLGPCH